MDRQVLIGKNDPQLRYQKYNRSFSLERKQVHNLNLLYLEIGAQLLNWQFSRACDHSNIIIICISGNISRKASILHHEINFRVTTTMRTTLFRFIRGNCSICISGNSVVAIF